MWFVNRAGVGDEVAVTAVVREYRRCYPMEKIFVDTPRRAEIFANNPHITGGTQEVRPTVYLRSIDRKHELVGPMPVSYGIQAGITLHDATPEIWFTQAELDTARKYILGGLPPGKPIVAIDVWAKWPSRRWPTDRFCALAQRFLDHGWAVVELGRTDYDDRGACSTTRLPSTLCLFDKTGLRETAAVLAHADLYVGNDSGLMHMAAGCGTPQVAIFGPKPWYSRGYTNTYPVYAPLRCPTVCDNVCTQLAHPCMAPIVLDQVWAAVLAARALYNRQPPKVAK